LFEVAVDILKRTENVESAAAIRDAIRRTNYNSIVGRLAWDGKPVKNVSKTLLAGGQWIPGSKFKRWTAGQKFRDDLVIVTNGGNDTIGVQRKVEALP
jgi:branched-chain amino acid transport system substrate-binding protein